MAILTLYIHTNIHRALQWLSLRYIYIPTYTEPYSGYPYAIYTYIPTYTEPYSGYPYAIYTYQHAQSLTLAILMLNTYEQAPTEIFVLKM